MPYEHSLRSQKERASDAKLAYNEKSSPNEPIQNYDDKVNKVKVTWSRQNDKKVSEKVLY